MISPITCIEVKALQAALTEALLSLSAIGHPGNLEPPDSGSVAL